MPYRCLFVFLIAGYCAYGQTDSLAWSVNLDDVVVTAQYAPTNARNAVHRVEVIQKREWREQGLLTLSDLLQRQLTLSVTPDLNNPEYMHIVAQNEGILNSMMHTYHAMRLVRMAMYTSCFDGDDLAGRARSAAALPLPRWEFCGV